MTTAVAAPEATTDDQAAKGRAVLAAQGLLNARQAGFTRPELASLMGLTSAKVWRIEQGRIHDSEFELVDAVLAKIDAGDVQPTKASKPADPRQAKIDAALAVIDNVDAGATKATLWQALADVAQTLRGDDEPPADDAQ